MMSLVVGLPVSLVIDIGCCVQIAGLSFSILSGLCQRATMNVIIALSLKAERFNRDQVLSILILKRLDSQIPLIIKNYRKE